MSVDAVVKNPPLSVRQVDIKETSQKDDEAIPSAIKKEMRSEFHPEEKQKEEVIIDLTGEEGKILDKEITIKSPEVPQSKVKGKMSYSSERKSAVLEEIDRKTGEVISKHPAEPSKIAKAYQQGSKSALKEKQEKIIIKEI